MHSSKHQGRAARTNGLAAGRLGWQADLLNADFIAQPFCLPLWDDTLSVSCVISPYCDATSWQTKSTHTHTHKEKLSWSVALAAEDHKSQRLQVALSVMATLSLGRAATHYI